MNKYQIPRNEAIIIEKFILTIISTNKDLITYETDTLVFNEMDFSDVLYFHIFKDNIFFQYILSSKDQTDFKDTIKKIELNDNEIDIKKISKIKFENCSFINMMINDQSKIKEISFIQCDFNGEASIQNNQNIKLLIELSTFNKYVQLQRSKFEKLEIKTSIFKNIVNFENCHFNGEINFENISFLDNVNFSMAKIKNELDLTKVFFKEEVKFYGIKQKDDKNLQAKNIANRETARIIKNSFEKQNNIIEANKFYALEMEKRKEELNNNKENWVDKLIFNIHGLSSNHSQSPLKALFWILIIAFISATIDFFSMTQNGIFIHCKSYLLLGLTMFVPILFYIAHIIKDNFFTFSVFVLFLIGSSYCLITKDVHFYLLAKTLNPFKTIIDNDDINIFQLFFKIILAYLYYQFVVSIRQNTRRK